MFLNQYFVYLKGHFVGYWYMLWPFCGRYNFFLSYTEDSSEREKLKLMCSPSSDEDLNMWLKGTPTLSDDVFHFFKENTNSSVEKEPCCVLLSVSYTSYLIFRFFYVFVKLSRYFIFYFVESVCQNRVCAPSQRKKLK